jgi:aldehyde:ferredoxin oxidoreductase
MDMVNNQIPTFEDKAEALQYFPMFRTWFGLMGLCKLPWNDVEPANNAETDEPAKVPEHVDNYVKIYTAVTGKHINKEELVRQSERVYNFQRIFNLRKGFGTREHDAQPYRACGPLTAEEYESRAERYDKQLQDWMGIDPAGKSTDEKWPCTANIAKTAMKNCWTPCICVAVGPKTACPKLSTSKKSAWICRS